ncbi:hypothetical protein AZSI13_16120 [Azospira sp. I13]|nr:hypothetical protein AZSI13_16120 [Azospira sp. I13]
MKFRKPAFSFPFSRGPRAQPRLAGTGRMGRMGRLGNFTPALGLWLANALLLCLLIVAILYQAARLFGFLPLSPKPLALPAAASAVAAAPLDYAQARNPFDPAGQPWGRVAAPQGNVRPSGPVGGIMMFPGVSLALTPGGAVKPGEALANGTLKEVGATQVTVQTPEGTKVVDLPARRRPSLQQLNARRAESRKETSQ